MAASPIQTSAADLVVTYDERILGEKNLKPALPLSFSTMNGVRAQLLCDQHTSFATLQRVALCTPGCLLMRCCALSLLR